MLLFANFGPVLYRKSKLNVFTRNLRRFKVLKKKKCFWARRYGIRLRVTVPRSLLRNLLNDFKRNIAIMICQFSRFNRSQFHFIFQKVRNFSNVQINWSKQCMNYVQINVDDRLRWYKMELTSTGWTSSPISVFVAKSVLSICCCYYMLMIFSEFDFFLFGYYLLVLIKFR